MHRTIILGLFGLTLAGCSSTQPVMTIPQQTSYNECMSGHWSGEADTFLWGPIGWAYHDSLQKDCYARASSLGSASVSGEPDTSSAAVKSDQPAAGSTPGSTQAIAPK